MSRNALSPTVQLNQMKVIHLTLVFLAITVSVFYLLTILTLNKLSVCLETENGQLDLLKTRAMSERWNKQKVCENGKQPILNTISCFQKVNASSIIPIKNIEALAKIIKPNFSSLDRIVGLHNSSCSPYPEAIIPYP